MIFKLWLLYIVVSIAYALPLALLNSDSTMSSETMGTTDTADEPEVTTPKNLLQQRFTQINDKIVVLVEDYVPRPVRSYISSAYHVMGFPFIKDALYRMVFAHSDDSD